MVVDLFLVFSFIKRLVTPFNKWAAFKEGIIDAKGNILVRRRDFTKASQRKAFGIFDQLILNLKKLLAKLPGGQTRLASYAAALWLIKESEEYQNKTGTLFESAEIDEEYIENAMNRFVEEYADIIEEQEIKLDEAKKKVSKDDKGELRKLLLDLKTANSSSYDIRQAVEKWLNEKGYMDDVEEVTGVGGGAIAGLGVGASGEPGVSKKAQGKYKKKNFIDFMSRMSENEN